MAGVDRIQAEWLTNRSTQAVFDALASAGIEGRVVGGAVRNTLLGKPVSDIDIATPALPEAVMAAAKAAGLGVVPTGLAHGTVTVIADNIPHEVTTLRRDMETDGRHAVVAFSDDWRVDAARRDFTINALYCGRAGEIIDPLGGLADLEARRVRFIGDAQDRIREDYLRILRFFRFSAEYAAGAFDSAGLAAAVAQRDGLWRLSAERIRAELLKLLVAPRAADAIDTMIGFGFLSPLLGLAPYPGLFRRAGAIEATRGDRPDAMLRLGLLATAVPDHAKSLAKRLRLSGSERGDLITVASDTSGGRGKFEIRDPVSARVALYRHGRRAFRLAMLSHAARQAPEDGQQQLELLDEVTGWEVPSLPVSGRDLILLGVAPGPDMGDALRSIERQWIRSDFSADREALLADWARQTKRG